MGVVVQMFHYWSFCPRDIFDELLETEKNAQPLSMEVGRSVRQPL